MMIFIRPLKVTWRTLDVKSVQKAQNHWTAHNTTLYNTAGAQTTYGNNQIQPTTKKHFTHKYRREMANCSRDIARNEQLAIQVSRMGYLQRDHFHFIPRDI